MNVWELIKSDLKRICEPTWGNAVKCYFFPHGKVFAYQVWLRIVHDIKKSRIKKYLLGPLAFLFLKHYEYKYGIHCDTNIEIGEGLCIVHGGSVYLNCRGIGRNFTVFHNVTLGEYPGGGIPIVEDDVTIYPGAVVCGEITLRNRCTVGALTYVDKDVEEGAKVIGKA